MADRYRRKPIQSAETPPISRLVVMPSGAGQVMLGDQDAGFFAFDSETARDLARRLLINADWSEGRRPAHVYQVDAGLNHG